ncbi:MAG: hypothetical protein KME60_03550 [Cyanomargarita calcarea GSE-NOS-MK-12-04C]|uniref:Uncharacterized protein n=1 Tax=Cyanomargarita calcarea GSE-NOS-MK-12-04C TaxID=2839659 RepID=A0A951QK98_9CYAN|nr:hypothetical protein [Cyanomargarita calcarea GSE-NOS-MK-12-04C]
MWDQIREFKDIHSIGGKIWNKETKKWDSIDDYHVDHDYPFSMLLDDFCKIYGYSFDEIEVSSGLIVSDEIRTKWQRHHLVNASLQMLPISENLKKGSKYDISLRATK